MLRFPGAPSERTSQRRVCLKTKIRIGDRLRIGSAEFLVTKPRMPCFKLGIRFERLDMVKRFLSSGRTGFYLSVSQEGVVSAGDAVAVTARDSAAVTVAVRLEDILRGAIEES